MVIRASCAWTSSNSLQDGLCVSRGLLNKARCCVVLRGRCYVCRVTSALRELKPMTDNEESPQFKELQCMTDNKKFFQFNKRQCAYLSEKLKQLLKNPEGVLEQSCVLKDLYICVIRKALTLMQDCCTEKWLLKAVEFGNCEEHFLEVLLDFLRLPYVENLFHECKGKPLDMMDHPKPNSNNTPMEVQEMSSAWESDRKALMEKVIEVQEMLSAWESDRTALMEEVRNTKDVDSEYYLREQLKENPSLDAPPEISKYVTNFSFSTTRTIYSGGGLGGRSSRDYSGGIVVFPVTLVDNKAFVIKMLYSKHKAEGSKPAAEEQLQKEANVMKKCRHPYAVGLLGYWEARRECTSLGQKVPLLLMELMECNLAQLIKRNKKAYFWGSTTRGFSALNAIKLMLPVAKVLRHLHSIEVVHRDLKPQNILYTHVPKTKYFPKDISVKLADFGDAQEVCDGGNSYKAGTTEYMDPDVARIRNKPEEVDLKKADVFSFGLVFGEVLTGLSPAEALHCMSEDDNEPYVLGYTLHNKYREGKRPPLPKDTPEFVTKIVESCLDKVPDERPSFENICWKLQIAELLLVNGINR